MSIDPLSAPVAGAPGPGADLFPTSTAPTDAPSSSAKAPVDKPPSLPQTRPVQVNASFGEDNLIIYRIVDKETGDLIQQIPPEQLLEIARGVQQLLECETPTNRLDVTS